jgi:hypothetical protein
MVFSANLLIQGGYQISRHRDDLNEMAAFLDNNQWIELVEMIESMIMAQ